MLGKQAEVRACQLLAVGCTGLGALGVGVGYRSGARGGCWALMQSPGGLVGTVGDNQQRHGQGVGAAADSGVQAGGVGASAVWPLPR